MQSSVHTHTQAHNLFLFQGNNNPAKTHISLINEDKQQI